MTTKLTALYRRRQEQLVAAADRAANAAGRAVGAVWRQVLALLRFAPNPWEAFGRARALFRLLPYAHVAGLAASLERTALWGYRNVARDVAPRVARRVFEDLADDLAAVLFPPLSLEELLGLVNHPRQGLPWYESLARSTKLAQPEALAGILVAGITQGKGQAEIARDLLPAVDGYRVSARRVARTETLRVAHAANMAAHGQLGDLVIGYQIHATLDANTRPAHRARNGLKWLKDSGEPMQAALHMDGPTLPDGYNCRCWLSPIIRR